MNITAQKKLAQAQQPTHNKVVNVQPPANNVAPLFAGQHQQSFAQGSNFMQLGNAQITHLCTRVKMVIHGVGFLSISVVNYSLDPVLPKRPEANELYFWKVKQGGISNATN